MFLPSQEVLLNANSWLNYTKIENYDWVATLILYCNTILDPVLYSVKDKFSDSKSNHIAMNMKEELEKHIHVCTCPIVEHGQNRKNGNGKSKAKLPYNNNRFSKVLTNTSKDTTYTKKQIILKILFLFWPGNFKIIKKNLYERILPEMAGKKLEVAAYETEIFRLQSVGLEGSEKDVEVKEEDEEGKDMGFRLSGQVKFCKNSKNYNRRRAISAISRTPSSAIQRFKRIKSGKSKSESSHLSRHLTIANARNFSRRTNAPKSIYKTPKHTPKHTPHGSSGHKNGNMATYGSGNSLMNETMMTGLCSSVFSDVTGVGRNSDKFLQKKKRTASYGDMDSRPVSQFDLKKKKSI